MEVGFKPETPQRAETTMSITALMQPMFLHWLHRSTGPTAQENPLAEKISAPPTDSRGAFPTCEKPSHYHRVLGGRPLNSNILRLAFWRSHFTPSEADRVRNEFEPKSCNRVVQPSHASGHERGARTDIVVGLAGRSH
jgi:hypothetical protein